MFRLQYQVFGKQIRLRHRGKIVELQLHRRNNVKVCYLCKSSPMCRLNEDLQQDWGNCSNLLAVQLNLLSVSSSKYLKSVLDVRKSYRAVMFSWAYVASVITSSIRIDVG